MTYGGQCVGAAVRATCVAAACLPAGAAAARLLSCGSPAARRAAWALVLAPLLTPALLVGYAYSHFSLSLVRHATWNGLLYAALVCLRLAPVAAVVLHVAPAGMSPQAVQCRRLARGRGLRERLRYAGFRARALGRGHLVAFALVFLLAFQEFEIASLFGVRTWTVALFDAHAGGLALSESLRRALGPAGIELVALAVMFAVLLRGEGRPLSRVLERPRTNRAVAAVAWAWLALGLALILLVPAAIVLRGALAGAANLARTFALGGDLAASLLLGGCGAGLAYGLAGLAMPGGPGGRGGRTVALALAALGLLGPLVLSLLVVAAFGAPLVREFYDTPVPLVLTLGLLLAGPALGLRWLLRALGRAQALHAARLLGAAAGRGTRRWGRRLAWDLHVSRHAWVAFLLFCWAYYELTASAVLAPPAMTPVTVRLYNLMHYGQSAVLSAMVAASFLAPLLLVAAGWGASRAVAHCTADG